MRLESQFWDGRLQQAGERTRTWRHYWNILYLRITILPSTMDSGWQMARLWLFGHQDDGQSGAYIWRGSSNWSWQGIRCHFYPDFAHGLIGDVDNLVLLHISTAKGACIAAKLEVHQHWATKLLTPHMHVPYVSPSSYGLHLPVHLGLLQWSQETPVPELRRCVNRWSWAWRPPKRSETPAYTDSGAAWSPSSEIWLHRSILVVPSEV